MKYQNTSHQYQFSNRLLWFRIALAVVVALTIWLSDGSPAEASVAHSSLLATYDTVDPIGLVATSQGDDTTAFREEDAGFSAHHRVPDYFQGNGHHELQPRLNVIAITDALLDDPEESNDNRLFAGVHVDSGGNFGIVELPMVPAKGFGTQLPPAPVTVYFDDRGWVVAYLPADAPSASIWRHDPTDQPDNDRPANDLAQNLLVLAINEVLAVARDDVPEIADASHDTVGYYHWQHPDLNSFVLFGHRSKGGTSDPIRFVVPPAIEDIRSSAAVLITESGGPGQFATHAQLMVDERAVVEVQQPSRLAAGRFELKRTVDVTRLYEVTVAVDEEGAAEGVVMLLYKRPGS